MDWSGLVSVSSADRETFATKGLFKRYWRCSVRTLRCQIYLPLILFILGLAGAVAAQAYDPLAMKSKVLPAIDLVAKDSARSREIPMRVYLPETSSNCPVVLFSHGLGGSKEGSSYLGKHWASRGYVAVFMQHPGSDAAVWQHQERGDRLPALARAATAENWRLRIEDVGSVLGQLQVWNSETGSQLEGRLDLDKVGMSGHSFGAVTTQWVAGQQGHGISWARPEIKAAIALSPSPPRNGSVDDAFGKVSIPWLLITGTEDDSPLSEMEAVDRLKVFPALPPGEKYELVLAGARHSAFSDHRLLPGHAARNSKHHPVVKAITTAFWDSALLGDQAAKDWLNGEGAKSILEPKDRWQKK